MTAEIVQLHPDEFVPLRFEIPPETAKEIHHQYVLATAVIERVQQLRNEIHQSGEPLPPDKGLLLRFLAKNCGL
jgi:hypothetical protein